MHREITPNILYFGTPVVLISTLNEDGSANLAPMSSIWWLGWTCVIGLDASSQTAENIRRTGECVLNLASANLVDRVDKLAKTTGRKNLPLHKKALGYRYESQKFNCADLTALPSLQVAPPRVAECLVQLEATLVQVVSIGKDSEKMAIPTLAFELTIKNVHADDSILLDANSSYIDPEKWHPLIMSFRQFYTTNSYIHPSRLAQGKESQYAPWKLRGWKGRLTRWLIKRNTKKYLKDIDNAG